jgi:hypothetical protein
LVGFGFLEAAVIAGCANGNESFSQADAGAVGIKAIWKVGCQGFNQKPLIPRLLA